MALIEQESVERGESHLRLQTIVRLRWVAVAGQILAVLMIYAGLGFDLPIGWCALLIAISAWMNVFLRLRYVSRHRLTNTLATGLLAYDILQLAALLWLTGGIENPFMVLIVAPVTVSAAGLPARNTIFLGILAVAATLVLILSHAPLPWYDGQSFGLPRLYKFGMAASVATTLVFLALYAARLSKEARQMSQALAATELVLAREQKLHALDGLAAAAAHELGTPLSTITLIAKELERELPPGSPLADDAALLKSQSERCREILRKLTQSPSESDPLVARRTLSSLIEEAAAPYNAFDTTIAVTVRPNDGVEGDAASEPVLLRRPGVVYGLGNLIENAADFARAKVDVTARWDKNVITCAIADDGPGFSSHVLDRIGEPYVTSRTIFERDPEEQGSGLGLGFFIAKTLLERSGATVDVSNKTAPETGAVVRITWPRAVFEGSAQDQIWDSRPTLRIPAKN
jgi:two-component system, sensor histidine kinase RegB